MTRVTVVPAKFDARFKDDPQPGYTHHCRWRSITVWWSEERNCWFATAPGISARARTPEQALDLLQERAQRVLKDLGAR